MKYAALSFDDGPNAVVTPLVLDLLEKYKIKASFFLIGQNITTESIEVMKRAAAMGCDLENHSYYHKDMAQLTREEIEDEVGRTSALIEEHTGKKAEFFRPPYISYNNLMADCIKLPFICGCGCDDWNEEVSVETRIEELLRQAQDGVIYLLHDMDYNFKTVEALKTVIPELINRGYEFVTVKQLFEIKGVVPEVHTGNIYSVVLQS